MKRELIFGLILIGILILTGCVQEQIKQTNPSSGAVVSDPSPKLYCGDNRCNNNENCETCSSDCGECKRSIGEYCSYDSQCRSGYCVHHTCRSSSTYCGDSYCDGEEMYNCYADCDWCGDGTCDFDESYSDCSSDCKKVVLSTSGLDGDFEFTLSRGCYGILRTTIYNSGNKNAIGTELRCNLISKKGKLVKTLKEWVGTIYPDDYKSIAFEYDFSCIEVIGGFLGKESEYDKEYTKCWLECSSCDEKVYIDD